MMFFVEYKFICERVLMEKIKLKSILRILLNLLLNYIFCDLKICKNDVDCNY